MDKADVTAVLVPRPSLSSELQILPHTGGADRSDKAMPWPHLVRRCEVTSTILRFMEFYLTELNVLHSSALGILNTMKQNPTERASIKPTLGLAQQPALQACSHIHCTPEALQRPHTK